MKTVIGLFVCVLSLSLVSTVSAVTVDLSSTQEGTTVAPGDTVELSLNVTNDSEEVEFVIAFMDVEVGDRVSGDGIPEPGPGNIPGISHKPIRIKLAPGESTTIDYELVLPDYANLPAGTYAFTISIEAKGLLSKTESSDTLEFFLEK
jgi:uncharacterized membrane protein